MLPDAIPTGCASWDIKELCCPAGCAARKSKSHWAKADDILQACMRGIGCTEGESKNASVFMRCDCPKE